MKSRIKGVLRRLSFKGAELAGTERQSILLGEIRAAQIRELPRLRSLADAEFCVSSQWGEDGIISWLVDTIQPPHRTFVEFGVEEFREANCRYLMMSRNWSGLIIDGSEANIAAVKKDTISYKYDLTSVCAFIDSSNIAAIIAANGFSGPLGILSVDIDGVDYWIVEAIKNDCDIVVVEYNDLFSGRAVSVPYDKNFNRLLKHWSGMYWGASLDAFRYLLEGRGYVFVGTNKVGTNAFFVAGQHRRILADRVESFIAWPCRMREVRGRDGKLALKTYREAWPEIRDLPLVDVADKAMLTVGDVIK